MDDRRITVEMFSGGTGQSRVATSDAPVILAADSLQEVERLPEGDNLITIALGRDLTEIQLLERCQAWDPRALQLLAAAQRDNENVDLALGLGQTPLLGELLIRDFQRQGGLTRPLEQALRAVIAAGNGRLDGCLVVREMHSNAGGMGAGAGWVITDAFCAHVAARTGMKIRRCQMRVGAMTYTDVAERAFENVGRTTARDLARLADLDSHKRETWTLLLLELPVCDTQGIKLGTNRVLRDRLFALLAQARYTPEVTEELETKLFTNPSDTPRYSKIARLQTHWSTIIAPEALARAAAVGYRRLLEATDHQPRAEVPDIEELTVVLQPGPSPLPRSRRP